MSALRANTFYEKTFPIYDSIIELKIPDNISKEPVNIKILKVVNKKNAIGYIRNIATTTGCDSACLPLIFTLFYDINLNFLKTSSQSGLSKIGHASFTQEDYSRLNLILTLAPSQLNSFKHPKELTDAISGATLKKFSKIVVKGAAYSTLRIHLYNQDTLKLIKSLTLSKQK